MPFRWINAYIINCMLHPLCILRGEFSVSSLLLTGVFRIAQWPARLYTQRQICPAMFQLYSDKMDFFPCSLILTRMRPTVILQYRRAVLTKGMSNTGLTRRISTEYRFTVLIGEKTCKNVSSCFKLFNHRFACHGPGEHHEIKR
jgi:hypothetical protein